MSVDPISALPSRPSPGAAGARLGQLYTEHSRMVYGICRMLLRDPDEAEDATQQVFLSAYRNLLTGTEVRDPAAWLGTIARNACRRRAVARLREPLAVDEGPTLVSPGAEETALGREEAAALYAELAVLPAKQREAVVLRDLYGLRYDEVATALGTSRPAVEALLFRGRRRLQRRLRPGLAAGVLVVPLAVQESIAYAVPGFATAAAPAGAAVTAAGIPILAKLAAAGAAVGIAGSAGVVAERSFHDPPRRPAETRSEHVVPRETSRTVEPAALLAVPPGGFPLVGTGGGDDSDTGEADERDAGERGGADGDGPTTAAGGVDDARDKDKDARDKDKNEAEPDDSRGDDRGEGSDEKDEPDSDSGQRDSDGESGDRGDDGEQQIGDD